MENKLLSAVVISTNEKISVYKSKLRDAYIVYPDCNREYKKSELRFV